MAAPTSLPPSRRPGAARADRAGRADRGAAPDRWWAPALLPGGWTWRLLGVIGGLVLLHLVVTALLYFADDFLGRDTAARLLDLNGEGGLPAWFATLMLAGVALSLWLLARRSAASDRSRWVRHERVLALVFLYLSLDEMTSLHELSIGPVQRALDLSGILTYAWVVVFVPVTLVVALLSIGWLRSLPVGAARLVVLSGVLYVGGAAGVELVGAGLEDAGQRYTFVYSVAVAVEELGEMLGVLLMLSVVTWLRHQPERSGR